MATVVLASGAVAAAYAAITSEDAPTQTAGVIADAGRAIGKAAATLVNVLNPELLIVGGDLSEAGELLLDGVRESLMRSALPTAAEAADVVAGTLGDRAEVLGAIALVLSESDRDHPIAPVPRGRSAMTIGGGNP